PISSSGDGVVARVIEARIRALGRHRDRLPGRRGQLALFEGRIQQYRSWNSEFFGRRFGLSGPE
ncbi:MAG: hypothetical protein JW940_06690, partial [Polyangiaceae bacterium]|nr:hypothetical protein [Polyangiaceae bacterium]